MSQRFTLNGKSYPAVGSAIDHEGTRDVLRLLMTASLYVVRALTDFYNLKREMVDEAYFQQAQSLEDKYSHIAELAARNRV